MLSLGTAGMTVVGLVAVLVATLYVYLKVVFGYWQRRNIYCPEQPSFPFGNFADCLLGRVSLGMKCKELYMKYRKEPYFGTYFANSALLQINDPEIVKHVFVKDFPSFNGRGMHCDPDRDPLSGHLFILSGPRWKNLRVKLTPTFTTGKIKYMFDKVKDCAKELQEKIHNDVVTNGGTVATVDIREYLARFSTDVISSVAFGIEPNSLKDPNSEFRRIGKRILEPSVSVSLRLLASFFLREVMSLFSIRTAPGDVDQFMRRIVTETVKYREEHKVDRPDMMNMMIQLKNNGFLASDTVLEGYGNVQNGVTQENGTKSVQTLSLNDIIAQCFVFFTAGFETTSSTTSFTLYELAKHPDIQDKVLREVDDVMRRHDNKVSYEAIMDMPYLDKVINETLRMYPAVPFLTREAMKPCKLPLTDVVLEEGTRLVIPVQGFHYDPEFFPDPEKYDPERFTEGNKTWPTFAYIPFGEGPRICIGMRFALVQVKTSLMTLLSKFRVDLGEGVPRKIQIDPRSIVPNPVELINLKMILREK